uniref:Isoform 2 of EPIDERMAL PATTERNING FACTOR-like protein 6 n=1 Tax=Arabidopsis thaliana TaxID=3702 RepID=Q1PEY6-2|nr:hypothetical protein [Arabidopsis thaliana]
MGFERTSSSLSLLSSSLPSSLQPSENTRAKFSLFYLLLLFFVLCVIATFTITPTSTSSPFSDCDGMSRLTGHAEMPCTPKEILSRRIGFSAHEDKDSTQLLVRSPLVGPCLAYDLDRVVILAPTVHVNV